MGYAERHIVTAAVDGSGDFTGYSPVISGKILAIHYVKTDYTDGVDFTITVEATAQGLWTESNVNAAKTVAPRQPTHDLIGVASLYAAAGEGVETPVVVGNDRVKIVIANGGVSKTGAFHIIVG